MTFNPRFLSVCFFLLCSVEAFVPSNRRTSFQSNIQTAIFSETTTTNAASDVSSNTTVPTTTISSAATTSKKAGAAKPSKPLYKLQGKLLKQMRNACKDYQMLEQGDHIMVCVSGGKDSATLLYLLLLMQEKVPYFKITVVHVDQQQPGYDGTSLVHWLEKELKVPYKIIREDTYSVVIDKTPANKAYCTICSRLRRGILYSTAMELGCNKMALGHHADDAMETMFLNMIHNGQMKSMPARYTSQRGKIAVMRPLMYCLEEDIAEYAKQLEFPILPCNLCGSQANLQRPQVKELLQSMQDKMNPNLKQSLLHAMMDVRPSHLLDQDLRQSCNLDRITGEPLDSNDNDESPYEDDSDQSI